MESYIDYTYYHNTFGGTLVPQEQFDRYSMKASSEVRERILNRNITGYETQIKNTTCEVVELIFNQDKIKENYNKVLTGEEKLITSEKVGDYSRNIATTNIADLKQITSSKNTNKEITELINKNLMFTGLLYRGICVQ